MNRCNRCGRKLKDSTKQYGTVCEKKVKVKNVHTLDEWLKK